MFKRDPPTVQSSLFRVKSGHCCGEWLWELKISTDDVVESGAVAIARQLLEGQRKLACLNCGWLGESSSFCLPEKCRWRNKGFLEFLSPSEMSLLGLILVRIGSRGLPNQHEDHSGSGTQSFPEFHCWNSGMSLKRVQCETWTVGSEEIHLVVISDPECDFLSYCLIQFFCHPTCNFFWRPWVIFSYWILGVFVFRACSFFGWLSWLSPLMAANFLFFFRLAITKDEKSNQRCFKTELMGIFFENWKKGKVKFPVSTVTALQRQSSFLWCFVVSFLLFIFLPWRETELYTRQVKVKIGKSTCMNKYQSGNANSGQK